MIDGTIPDAGTTRLLRPGRLGQGARTEERQPDEAGCASTPPRRRCWTSRPSTAATTSPECGSRPTSIRRRSTSGCTSHGSVSARRRARCSSSSTRTHSRLRVTTQVSTSHSIRRSPRQSRRSSIPVTRGRIAWRVISRSTGISRATRRHWACGRSTAVGSGSPVSPAGRYRARCVRRGERREAGRGGDRSLPPRASSRRWPGDVVQDLRQRHRGDRDRELGHGRLQGHDLSPTPPVSASRTAARSASTKHTNPSGAHRLVPVHRGSRRTRARSSTRARRRSTGLSPAISISDLLTDVKTGTNFTLGRGRPRRRLDEAVDRVHEGQHVVQTSSPATRRSPSRQG